MPRRMFLAPIDYLPVELVSNAFGYLTQPDLLRAGQVSRRWENIARTHPNYYWLVRLGLMVMWRLVFMEDVIEPFIRVLRRSAERGVRLSLDIQFFERRERPDYPCTEDADYEGKRLLIQQLYRTVKQHAGQIVKLKITACNHYSPCATDDLLASDFPFLRELALIVSPKVDSRHLLGGTAPRLRTVDLLHMDLAPRGIPAFSRVRTLTICAQLVSDPHARWANVKINFPLLADLTLSELSFRDFSDWTGLGDLQVPDACHTVLEIDCCERGRFVIPAYAVPTSFARAMEQLHALHPSIAFTDGACIDLGHFIPPHLSKRKVALAIWRRDKNEICAKLGDEGLVSSIFCLWKTRQLMIPLNCLLYDRLVELRFPDDFLPWFLVSTGALVALERLYIDVLDSGKICSMATARAIAAKSLFEGPLLDYADDYVTLNPGDEKYMCQLPQLRLLKLWAVQPVRLSSRAVANLGVNLSLFCKPIARQEPVRAALVLERVKFLTQGVHLALPVMFADGIEFQVRLFSPSERAQHLTILSQD